MSVSKKTDLVVENIYGENSTSTINIGNTLYIQNVDSTNPLKDNTTTDSAIYMKSYTKADTTGKIALDKQDGTNNLMLDEDVVLSVGNIDGDLLNGIDLSVNTITVNNIDTNTIDTKNIDIGDNDTSDGIGYINFRNANHGQLIEGQTREDGIGLRLSSLGKMQIKNATGDFTEWINLTGLETTFITELKDVTINQNILQDNDILRYDAVFDDWVNSSNLTIREYLTLENSNITVNNGYIHLNNSNISIDDNYGILDSIGSNILVFNGNTTSIGDGNYFKMSNGASGEDITLEADGVDTNINLDIKSKGDGDVTLTSDSGNVVVSSINLDVLGYVKNSIYRSSTKVADTGYNPEEDWITPLGYDTILYDFKGSDVAGTYFSNISVGIDGQKLNLIFNNAGSNSIELIADFDSNLITGSGNSGRLKFISTGQTANLVYLGGDIDKWQILNTGCIVLE